MAPKIQCVQCDRAPCTNHKGEQKDRTKTLAEFPDHILNDYIVCL